MQVPGSTTGRLALLLVTEVCCKRLPVGLPGQGLGLVMEFVLVQSDVMEQCLLSAHQLPTCQAWRKLAKCSQETSHVTVTPYQTNTRHTACACQVVLLQIIGIMPGWNSK